MIMISLQFRITVGSTSCEVKILRTADFNYDSAKHRLCTIHLSEWKQQLTQLERFLLISSVIEFDKAEMTRAAGALLSYLIKNKLLNQLEEINYINLNSISTISIDQYLNVDSNTLESLQIFRSEDHPR